MRGVVRAASRLLGWAVVVAWTTVSATEMHQHDATASTRPSPTSGPVREVMLPDGLSSAQSLTLDSSGRVWFAEKIGRTLSVYDPHTRTFASHALPASWGGLGFSQVTAGPDDTIWFTVTRWAEGGESPNLVGRFSPADGYFTKFALSNDAVPRELMVDANGTLWFVAANKGSLYRIDPRTLALKGYPLPTPNGHARGLAADAAGQIWFVLANTNKIGVFHPERERFAEHEVLTSFSNPGRLTIDRQARIWFVEVAANRIGAFNPSTRRFDEAIVPTAASVPVALQVDDNGNVWFLQYMGNKVAVFDPQTARFREFEIPTHGSLPSDLVLDRKRSVLWFTQSATEARRLGFLALAEALAAPNGAERVPHAPAASADTRGWLRWRWQALALFVAAGLLVAGGLLLLVRRRADRATGAGLDPDRPTESGTG